MLLNNRNLKKLSLNLMILLGASTVATYAAEDKLEQGTSLSVSSLTVRFNSPVLDKRFSSQAEGDVRQVSPLAARSIASSLKEEGEFRAQKLVEEAQREAQLEIDKIRHASHLEIEEIKKSANLEKEEIKSNLEIERVAAGLEIQKIHQGVEEEKEKAKQLISELEVLRAEKQMLEKSIEAAKADAVVTWSGMKATTSNVFSYLPGSSYFTAASPTKEASKPTDQS